MIDENKNNTIVEFINALKNDTKFEEYINKITEIQIKPLKSDTKPL